ncbi:conjugal transfer protein TraF [Vibrio ziniensis]|uniref:Conjugal transfer protein TraF n=1 Tax=Vibrio ziniensis TaxID=2711221 RepID=A0A6G7CH02_9VIBR|nr:conjugal transfer protein TraF [Vibrio ziniensis]QIH41382.1 conjugal transfer protein TraF [Vibrio ziniensis]
MKFKTCQFIGLLTLFLNIQPVHALSFDSRSTAMGGIGVSSADYLTASFHNPALVAKHNATDKFAVLPFSIGGDVRNDQAMLSNLYDAIDAVKEYNRAANLGEEIVSGVELIKSLSALKYDKADIFVGVGMAVAIPSETLSVNLFTHMTLDTTIRANIIDEDLDLLSYIESYRPQSSGNITGIRVHDIGFSLAKPIPYESGTLFYGLSPKIQLIYAFNYSANLDTFNASDFDRSDYVVDKSTFNLDGGLAYSYTNGVSVGLVAKNLFPKKISTKEYLGIEGTYSLNPVYKASVSYSNSSFTLGLDTDLNATKRFESLTFFNFKAANDDIQMAGVGGEYKITNWCQLRTGYQMDLKNNLSNVMTMGMGFIAAKLWHIDLSAAYANKNQFGASLQNYFTF